MKRFQSKGNTLYFGVKEALEVDESIENVLKKGGTSKDTALYIHIAAQPAAATESAAASKQVCIWVKNRKRVCFEFFFEDVVCRLSRVERVVSFVGTLCRRCRQGQFGVQTCV